jgi:septum formation protein
MTNVKIILASGSKQRKLMMDSLGINYSVIPANIDEKQIRENNLKIRAKKIATAKAKFVANNNDGIIIAADSFIYCQGKVLEKPENLEQAKFMLKLQSDNTGIFYTGFCYIDKYKGYKFSTTTITKYSLRKLSEEEINYFVKSNPVLTWAGAFASAYIYQSTFLKKINGTLTGMLYGLPTEFLIPCLEKSGIIVKGNAKFE